MCNKDDHDYFDYDTSQGVRSNRQPHEGPYTEGNLFSMLVTCVCMALVWALACFLILR